MIAKTAKLAKATFTHEFFASLVIFEAFVRVFVNETASKRQET